jgi:hypothetical protein
MCASRSCRGAEAGSSTSEGQVLVAAAHVRYVLLSLTFSVAEERSGGHDAPVYASLERTSRPADEDRCKRNEQGFWIQATPSSATTGLLQSIANARKPTQRLCV